MSGITSGGTEHASDGHQTRDTDARTGGSGGWVSLFTLLVVTKQGVQMLVKWHIIYLYTQY